MAPRIAGPERLKELLGIPFTPEQLSAITAPLAPNVIVAGAGSGKTTVMAARVVWLVGTGQVRPDQVLGLTFTNKAAGELADRVRRALVRAGVLDPEPVPGPWPAGPGPSGPGPGVQGPPVPGTAAPGPTGSGPTGSGPGPGVPGDGDEALGEPAISTYHAFAGQLLKEHGLRIGVEPSARLLADATRYQLAARVLRRAPGPYPALTSGVSALVSQVLGLEGQLAEHLTEPDELRAHDTALLETLAAARLTNDDLRRVPAAAAARLELSTLVDRYRAEKRRADLLDFGDQIAYCATLARTRPEVGRILRERFAVVLLDEYQDTSVAQRLLLAGLFGGGTGHPVTAVGDPCQAIYGWRGASVANLDEFPRHFPNRDGTPAGRHSLSENRRSGGRLLHLANLLAEPLRARHEGVEALRPGPGAEQDGRVRCALLPTHDEEIAWLAGSLAHLVRTGTPPGEIAVLCRGGRDFPDIHAALVERDVPVEVVGLSGLLHLPEVADLVAMCEVLQDPTANAALVRLLVGPRWRIGARDLALLGRRARALVVTGSRGADGARGADPGGDGGGGDDPGGRLAQAVEGTDPTEVVSLADALDTFLDSGPRDDLGFSPEARVRFARFAHEIRDLRRSLADPLMDVLHRVLAVTGLEVELSASPHALAARRRETLSAFLDVAASFADLDGDPSLTAFLGFLRTAAEYDNGLDNTLPGGENTVKVLTAHKAKGLEWDVVAVPGLVARAFPSDRVQPLWTRNAAVLPHSLRGDAGTLPDVEEWTAKGLKRFGTLMKDHQAVEELRLGYVTFTRPRSLLLGSGHWWGPSQTRTRGPSEFLRTLREHCEGGPPGAGEVEVWADPPEEGARNPSLVRTADHPWPLPLDPVATERRRRAARRVRAWLDRSPEERGSGERTGEGGGRPPADGPRPRGPAPRDGHAVPHDPHDPYPDDPDGPHRPYGRNDPDPRGGAETRAAVMTDDGGAAGSDDRGGSDDPRDGSGRADGTGWDDGSGWDDAVGRDDWSTARPGPVPAAPLPAAPGPGAPPAVPAPRGGADPEDHGDGPGSPEAGPLVPEEERLVASWDRDLEALAGELRRARSTVRDVPLPMSLSASQVMRLAADPDGFARDLARPVPREPQPAARRGTRFHAWVESLFAPLPLIGPDELPGAGEQEIDGEEDLQALKEAFLASPYGDRTPYRVEAPFQIMLAGRVVRGRIDAVYRDGDGGYEVVDWKTGRNRTADPLQLAVYRLAWAELTGTPPEKVSAAFLYVRTGDVVRPAGLPDRARLEAVLAG